MGRCRTWHLILGLLAGVSFVAGCAVSSVTPTVVPTQITIMQDPLASWAGIAGVIATFVIALLTFFNVRVARNSLKLMEQKEKRSQPSLQVFHINSYVKQDKEQGSRIYTANIGITCTSDTDNSVKDLSMKIYFKRDGEITSNIAIPTVKDKDMRITDLIGVSSDKILVVPLRIKAHEVITGWALFVIRDEFLVGSSIENYQVILTDAHDIESYFEIKVMQEIE